MTTGRHRLIRGCCLQVLPTLAAASVDLVVADLPYGITANPWDCAIPLAPLWAELLRVGKPACVYVFTATMRFACALLQSQPRLFRYDIVWAKSVGTDFLNARRKPLRAHESILVFCSQTCNAMSRSPMPYFPQVRVGAPYKQRGQTHGQNYNDGKPLIRRSAGNIIATRQPTTLAPFAACAKKYHPTQKPVALLAWLIRTYSAENATVLDPTSGVASTAVAAHRTGRRSISIERDPGYFAKGVERLRAEVEGRAEAAKPKRQAKTKRVAWAQADLPLEGAR